MLKSKNQNWLLAIVLFFIASGTFAQNLQISGGNAHTVAICENGDVFAWGKNDVGQLGPTGPGGFSNKPILVTGFPAGLQLRQTDAGSGSHTLALGCDGSVYAWGANATGQLGNGTTSGSSATPVKVVGIGGIGFLNGVKYVSGGNDESFAILNDGRLVSWGQNDKGQLGDNTIINRSFPNYVLKCDGTQLTDVIQVEAGDENCYALLADGSVWSWGDNLDNTGAALGRPPAVNPHCATRIVYGDNTDAGFTTTPVTNIVSISAGDRHVLMLDGTGTVWSFGGDWGVGQLGQGKGYQGSAHKVLAPKAFNSPWTTDPYTIANEYNTGPYLTGVTSISAGQAHSMAVLDDGNIVTFGANGFYDCGTSCAYLGGQLGIGMNIGTNNKGVEGPVYGLTGPGVRLKDVVSVSDGDAISIAVLANGDVYIAGSNSYGQVGIGIGGSAGGDKSDVGYFTKITIPTCTITTPCPLKPSLGADFSKCATISQTLYANVAPRPTYNFLWEYSATGTAPWTIMKNVTTFPIANADNLTVTANGYYRLSISDDRATLPANCAPCSLVGDTIHIKDPIANFGDPGDLTFCGTTATVNVTETGSSATTNLSSYEWYAALTAGTALATTTDIGTASLDVTTLIKTGTAPNRTAEVWVEDKSTFNATVATKAQIGASGQQTYGPTRINFSPIQSFSLNAVTVEWISYNSTPLELTLYDSGGNPLATGTAPNPGSGSYTNTVTFSPTPLLAAGGTYYITSSSSTRQYNTPGNAYSTNFQNAGIDVLDILSSDSPASTSLFAPFYGWNVTVGSPYPCGRLKVLIKEDCPPCNKPTSVTVNGGTSPINKCVGDAAFTTTGSYVNAGNPIANTTMAYVWYKQGSPAPAPTAYTNLTAPTPVATTASQTVTAKSFTAPVVGDAGTYILRVEDGTAGNALCFTESTVVLNVNPLPTITGTLTVCKGLTTQLTGSGTAATSGAWVSGTPANATVSSTGLVTGVAPGTSVITYTNNNGCKITATVTVNDLPTITGTLTVCKGLTTQLTGSGTAAASNAWVSGTPANATVSSTGLVTGVLAGTSVITYKNSDGCIITATVTVNDLPTITGTLDVCKGLTTQLTGSATAAASNAWVSGTPANATISSTGLVTGVLAGTSLITYTNNNGCLITATVTVNDLPTITGTLTVCKGLTTQLTGSGTAAASNAWVSGTPANATVSATGLVTGVLAGTSVITYKNNKGCIITETVTVNDLPTITGTLTVCKGLTTQLTGSGTAAATNAWVSGTPANATVSSTGLVTGVLAGTSVITYKNSDGCVITATVTVNDLPTITGTLTVCVGATTQLTGSGTAAASNAWVSGTPANATISATGLVTGVAAGTSLITYTNSNGCLITATVTVSPIPTISGTATICISSSTQLTGSGTAATSSPWVSGSPLIASVDGTGKVSGIAAGTSTITYTNSGGCKATQDVVVSATAAAGVTLTANPGVTICGNESVTFTAVASNGGNPTYEWTSSVSGLLASVTDTYSSSALANGEKISVKMTSDLGCASPKSDTKDLTMVVKTKATPTITIAASKTTICPTESVVFSISGQTNEGTAPTGPTYQWTKTPGGPILNATNATYTAPVGSITDQDVFNIIMTTGETCVTATTATQATGIAITVTPVPVLNVTIVADQTTICSGNTVNFTATPTGSGSTPAPKYEWFIGAAGSETSQGAATTTNPFSTTSLTTTAALSPQVYSIYVKALSAAECASTTASLSPAITVTVNAGVAGGTITTAKLTICNNTTPGAITAGTTPASGGATPVYTWQESIDGGAFVTANGTVNGTGFTPSGAKTGTSVSYKRIVTFTDVPSLCNKSESNIINITVLPALVAGKIGDDEGICINTAPKEMKEIALGATTGGAGSGYTYQWQYDAGLGFTDIALATNATYTSPAISVTTKFQRLDKSGTCDAVTTNIVTKTISPKEIITLTPFTTPVDLCVSATPTVFTAVASSDVPTSTLTYAWTLNGDPVGTNSDTYSYTPVIGNDNVTTKVIKVVVSTSNSCNTGDKESSFTVNLKTAVAPTVTISTPRNPLCEEFSTTFTAVAKDAGTPTYQWWLIPSSSGIPGQVGTNSPSYVSPTLLTQLGDQVYVEVTSSLGCALAPNPAQSNKITMDVRPKTTPNVIEPNTEICAPLGFTFSTVETTGNKYQWYKNGTAINNATNATFTAKESGLYSVEEKNAACGSSSLAKELKVIAKPIAYAGPDQSLPEGTLSALNGSGGGTYSWTPTTYLSLGTVSNPTFKATQTITYELIVKDGVCPSDPDYVTIYVVKPIKVPNVITVNGDGVNDDWKIENIEGYPNVIIEIYNRWGNLVWKTAGYPKNWDGTNYRNSEVLPEGTYFYIINLQSQVYPEPNTGWVQIVK